MDTGLKMDIDLTAFVTRTAVTRFIAVIASGAKQSPGCIGAITPGDCFASLAMTAWVEGPKRQDPDARNMRLTAIPA